MSVTKIRANQIVGITNQYGPIIKSTSKTVTSSNTTEDLIISGEYFNPDVAIEFISHTVNTIEFISSQQVRVNVTFRDIELPVSAVTIKLNNGIESIYDSLFTSTTGEIFIPRKDDLEDVSGSIVFDNGLINTVIFGAAGSTSYINVFDINDDFLIEFDPKKISFRSTYRDSNKNTSRYY